LDSGTRTLESLLSRYLLLKVLSEPTKDRYDLVVRNLTRHLAGQVAHSSDVALERVTVDALVAFRDWSLKRMRPTSFNTERCHLSALFNFAVRQKWMDTNPFREVPRAPVPKLLPRSIPRADLRASLDLLASAHTLDSKGKRADLLDPQWFWLAVVKTFYHTGIRKRQLIGMRWGDVDFNEKTIRLRADTSKTRREWLAPLPDALLPDLTVLRARTVEIRGQSVRDHQVFCLPLFSRWPHLFKFRELRPDTLDNFFQRLHRHTPKDAPRLSAHAIRHTTATILANNVPNLRLVQEQLGHASIKTTFGYVHPDLPSMRKALEAL
jgi:integrase